MWCAWLNHILLVFFFSSSSNWELFYFLFCREKKKRIKIWIQNCYIIQLWSLWNGECVCAATAGVESHFDSISMKGKKKTHSIFYKRIYYLSHSFFYVLFGVLTFVFLFCRRLFCMCIWICVENQNQKSIYFHTKKKIRQMRYKDMWTFMMSKFGEPRSFYCLNPADIERHELSYVSPIKWNISIEWIQTKNVTPIHTHRKKNHSNDSVNLDVFFSSLNISTTLFLDSINHALVFASFNPAPGHRNINYSNKKKNKTKYDECLCKQN